MKKNPDDLTKEEIKFLQSGRAAESVRQFTARQHETIGTRTSAYRKVARAARAERDALVEIAALEMARVLAAGELSAKERAAALGNENESLRRELERTRRALESAIAAPAMAINSGEE